MTISLMFICPWLQRKMNLTMQRSGAPDIAYATRPIGLCRFSVALNEREHRD